MMTASLTILLASASWMTPAAFGTLMALEPAIGVLLGLLVLHQWPAPAQILGVALVVIAGAAAQRNGQRHKPAAEPAPGQIRSVP